MRALEILKRDRDISLSICDDKSIISAYNEAIEEIINLKSKNEELSNILRDIDEALKALKGWIK